MLKAVAGKVDITPAEEDQVKLRGYPGGVMSYSTKDPPKDGLPIRPDRLYARILMLKQEEGGRAVQTAILVGLDCWAANEELITVSGIHGDGTVEWEPAIPPGTRAGWARAAGLATDSVSIHPTHAHSAPALTPAMADRVRAKIQELHDGSDWKEVTLHGGVVDSDLCRNRLDKAPKDDRVDRSLIVMDFRGQDDQSVAWLVNFGVHPTFFGDNRTTSADFVGVAMSELEKNKAPGFTALFLQGWSGDLEPNYDKELGAKVERRSYAHMKWMAGELAKQTTLALRQARSLGGDRLQVLKLKEPRRFPVKRDGLSDRVAFSGIAIGTHAVLVAVSGEMYQDYGPILTEYASPDTFMPSCGLVNGYSGYIPTTRGFGIPSYEINTSPFTREAEDYVRAAFKDLLDQRRARFE